MRQVRVTELLETGSQTSEVVEMVAIYCFYVFSGLEKNLSSRTALVALPEVPPSTPNSIGPTFTGHLARLRKKQNIHSY